MSSDSIYEQNSHSNPHHISADDSVLEPTINVNQLFPNPHESSTEPTAVHDNDSNSSLDDEISDVEGSGDKELFECFAELAQEKNSKLMSRLNSIYRRQSGIVTILNQLSDDFEENVSIIPVEIQKIDTFRAKLTHVKTYMQRITERIQILQQRMNRIRASLPSNSTVLMERPQDHGVEACFYYRCLAPNGLKYRTKPSSSAPSIPGKEIKYKQIVQVKERVFTCHENAVFLHVIGSGWLFENSERLRYMERVGSLIDTSNDADPDDHETSESSGNGKVDDFDI